MATHMKKRWFDAIFLLFTIFVLSSITAISAEKPSQAQNPWTVVVHTTVTQPARMAAFLNENFGVTGGVGGAGKTNVTLDGGKTWKKSESSGGCIYGIEIINSKLIWVCGANVGISFTTPGGIRLSSDGGQTFGDESNFDTSLTESPMSFINEQIGWIYQYNTLSATGDGGKTWRKIPLPKGASKIKAVALRSESAGYLLDESGAFYSTVNQGKTWSLHTVLLKKYPEMRIAQLESATAAIRFSDQDHGLVVISLTGKQSPAIIAFRTDDGGAKWGDELVSHGMGTIFLSPDGQFITSYLSGEITVYRYNDAGKEQ